VASHYELLGLKPTATPDELRRAFRAAAKRVHPDARPGPTDAMVAVNIAYETLKDPARRATYDRALSRGELVAPVRPTKAPQALDPTSYRLRVFQPLDRALVAELATLDDTSDDGSVDQFDCAVLDAAAALDEAYRGLYARLWPASLAAGLNLYGQGVQQAEAALEDYFRFAQHYDSGVLLEGREALRGAVRILARARGTLGEA
jgi:curved DNA-binding protein CbpA